MVATAVNITRKGINESIVQLNTTVTGALTVLGGVDVIPTTTEPNASSSIKKTNDYDFIVSTSGAATATTVNVASRTVTVSKSIGAPVSITTFFTDLLISGTGAKLHAIPKVNKNGKIDYEIIYTNKGNSDVSATLFIITLDVPAGTTPVFPAVLAAADPFATAVVLRDDTGLVRTYDYFMLSSQA